ncbi:MAG: SGNH/GDSL hydrolase family protein [Candidatus Korobacteraceae bacterium]
MTRSNSASTANGPSQPEDTPAVAAPAAERSPVAPKKSRWLGKIALAILVPLLALGLLEVAVRIYAHVTSQERLIVIDNITGWRLAPNVHRRYDKETQPYFIVTNSKGLRDVEHAYEKPPGVFRIVVIGDSFVFGAGGVEPSKRFTDILQSSLKNVEVINMGVPAYGADQEYLYLADEGLKYHPDLVLLCAFYNDFRESFSTINPSNGRPKGYLSLDGDQLVVHPPQFSLYYRLAQHSYLLGLADLGLSKISTAYDRAMRRRHGVVEEQNRLAVFRQIYASAADLCQQHGAAFVLVYLPFQAQYEKWVIQQVMDDLAAARGMKTLDLMETMKLANRAHKAYFPHDIHFNEYGNQVVAGALLEYLGKNGLLPPATLPAAGAVQ